MSRLHVDHADIARFAEDKVNLPRDKAEEYRAQARRLREKLDSYLSEHPDFTLKKMLLSGSLAKGTALRSLNDIDVACYISGASTRRAMWPRCWNIWPNVCARPFRISAPTRSSRRPTASRSRSGAPASMSMSCRFSMTATRNGTAISSARKTARFSGPASRSTWNLPEAQDGAADAFRAGGPAGEVLGARHEARARGVPLQVLHGGNGAGAPAGQRRGFLGLSGSPAAFLHLHRAQQFPRTHRVHRLLPRRRPSEPSPSRCRSSTR